MRAAKITRRNKGRVKEKTVKEERKKKGRVSGRH